MRWEHVRQGRGMGGGGGCGYHSNPDLSHRTINIVACHINV